MWVLELGIQLDCIAPRYPRACHSSEIASTVQYVFIETMILTHLPHQVTVPNYQVMGENLCLAARK